MTAFSVLMLAITGFTLAVVTVTVWLEDSCVSESSGKCDPFESHQLEGS